MCRVEQWSGTTVHDDHSDHTVDDCCSPAAATLSTAATVPASGPKRGAAIAAFRVAELDCATEEGELREVLTSLDGVRWLEFDLVARQVRVHHDLVSVAPITDAIRKAGMRPTLLTDTDTSTQPAGQRRLPRRTLLLAAIAGVLAVGSEIAVLAGAGEHSVLVAVMAGTAIVLGGRDTLRKGFQALRSRRLTIGLLMSVAVIGAVAIGQWPEAAVVIWLFGVAELIEAMSLERARHAIRSLVELAPETTLVRVGAEWTDTPTGDVPIGAIMLVKPGERIALDGTVAAGSSTVDQAPITGESVPVTKTAGDIVFAGTINQRGALEVTVTAAKGAGTLDRIARSIQEAQAERAPAQRFVDRFAAVYTPLVFLTAIVVATAPPLLGHGNWHSWLYRALVLLVLACPCALVISTPVTVVSGLGGAARRGILIKGGVHLENRTVALDKTGTLTHGRPTLIDLVNLSELGDDQILAIAASIEARSEHPVAHAITTAHDGPLLDIEHFDSIPGRGVTATINGTAYRIGNHALVEHSGLCRPDLERQLELFEDDAKTAIVLMDDNRVLAVLTVADDVKPTSREAIQELHALGVTTVMLTGDNQRTATAIAAQVGIADARGGLLPDDKLAAVTNLVANNAPVAMMDDDPRKIAETIRISTHTSHVLWQNISLALGIKAIFLALTLAGTASLWIAVLADMGTSLIVIANGLRLLRHPAHGTTPTNDRNYTGS